MNSRTFICRKRIDVSIFEGFENDNVCHDLYDNLKVKTFS